MQFLDIIGYITREDVELAGLFQTPVGGMVFKSKVMLINIWVKSDNVFITTTLNYN